MSCATDLDGSLSDVTGNPLLLEALVRHITSPRGSVIDAPNYGIDVRDYLGDDMTSEELGRLRGAVRAELLADERVLDVTVTTDFNSTTHYLKLGIVGSSAQGPFSMVLLVSAVTVQILSQV